MTGTPVDILNAERMGIRPDELTQDKVTAYQLEAFRRTLSYVKEHSDFYRERFAGIDPDAVETMDDIRQLPCTTEEELAGNEWRFQCVSSSKVSRNVTVPTSGTHGTRKRLSFSETDIDRSVAFIHRGFLTMNCTEGEKMLVQMSGNTPGSIGDMVKQAMEPLKMRIEVYGTVVDIKDAYEKIMEFKPGVIEGIPWQTAALARYGERFGNPEREFIRSVNLSADTVPESIARRLQKLWDCTVHRHYGMTEMCIFGGVECSHRMGYHLRPVDILYEIPETDENGLGEVVITTLDREAMPLIRYRTGDIGRLVTTKCGCGCTLTRIEKLYGRRSDLIRIGDKETFFSELADAVYSVPEVIDFDIGVMNNETVELTIKTLPGDELREDMIREALYGIPSFGEALKRKDALRIRAEQTDTFPQGYNLKKRVTSLLT